MFITTFLFPFLLSLASLKTKRNETNSNRVSLTSYPRVVWRTSYPGKQVNGAVSDSLGVLVYGACTHTCIGSMRLCLHCQRRSMGLCFHCQAGCLNYPTTFSRCSSYAALTLQTRSMFQGRSEAESNPRPPGRQISVLATVLASTRPPWADGAADPSIHKTPVWVVNIKLKKKMIIQCVGRWGIQPSRLQELAPGISKTSARHRLHELQVIP